MIEWERRSIRCSKVGSLLLHPATRSDLCPGRDPLHSFQLINDLSVHAEIFYLPPTHKPSPEPKSRQTALIAATLLSRLLSPSPSPLPQLENLLRRHTVSDLATRRRLYLAAALTPFRDTFCTEKKKQVATSEIVLREGVKVGLLF